MVGRVLGRGHDPVDGGGVALLGEDVDEAANVAGRGAIDEELVLPEEGDNYVLRRDLWRFISLKKVLLNLYRFRVDQGK